MHQHEMIGQYSKCNLDADSAKKNKLKTPSHQSSKLKSINPAHEKGFSLSVLSNLR